MSAILAMPATQQMRIITGIISHCIAMQWEMETSKLSAGVPILTPQSTAQLTGLAKP